jgi:threonyl-tRNA synthetase
VTRGGRLCVTPRPTFWPRPLSICGPGAQYAIGPAITDGFYYDFALPGGATFSDDDLESITARMRAIMAEDQSFVRQEHSIDDGLALFAEQPFKQRDHHRRVG